MEQFSDSHGTQLKRHPLTGNLTMGGFVEAYANVTQTDPNKECDPMGFFESVYKDAPQITPTRANDNHPPLAVGWGEEFLRRTYEAISCNPKKWEAQYS